MSREVSWSSFDRITVTALSYQLSRRLDSNENLASQDLLEPNIDRWQETDAHSQMSKSFSSIWLILANWYHCYSCFQSEGGQTTVDSEPSVFFHSRLVTKAKKRPFSSQQTLIELHYRINVATTFDTWLCTRRNSTAEQASQLELPNLCLFPALLHFPSLLGLLLGLEKPPKARERKR